MSGQDKRYLKRFIALFNNYRINLKGFNINKNVIPALQKGQEGLMSSFNKVEEFKNQLPKARIKHTLSRYVGMYEKATGVQELLALQKAVVATQERFMTAQERRRLAGQVLTDNQQTMLDLHSEMQNTSKADERYLKLVTDEHRALIKERSLRQSFEELEKEERERFAEMSSAVKLSHEFERVHAERSKYWYLVASICGTILGVGGTTLNNRIKMSEFKQLMEEQIARSTEMMISALGGENAIKNVDSRKLLPWEGMSQMELTLTQKMQEIEKEICGLSSKYDKVLDSFHMQEATPRKNFTEFQQLRHSDQNLPDVNSHVKRTIFINIFIASCVSLVIGCAIGRIF